MERPKPPIPLTLKLINYVAAVAEPGLTDRGIVTRIEDIKPLDGGRPPVPKTRYIRKKKGA